MDDWDEWDKKAASDHPIRFWLAETGLSKLQDFVFYIPTKYSNVTYYVNNRWVMHTHALMAHPSDIKPGKWYDYGNRFLPCLFNELVNFVEIELASHEYRFSNAETRKKYKQDPWYARHFLRTWRCPEAGLAHLAWQRELVITEDENYEPNGVVGEKTYQAKVADEILALYTWWTVTYKNRLSAYEASGWHSVCEKNRELSDGKLKFTSHPSIKDEHDAALESLTKIEEQYKQEEEEMLIRLIKIRESLWT